jgi:glutamine amidotransferase
MIAIIYNSAGNLRSVVKAINRLGYEPKITASPDDVLNTEAVILPGVGAAADTMANLRRLNIALAYAASLPEGTW